MSVTEMVRGTTAMEKKRVSISAKRQITIPQKFFTSLGFDTEAECMVRGNELVIRPVKTEIGGEFAEQILADLINQGYSGVDLLEAFRKEQKKVRPAVEAMLSDAEKAANGETDSASYADVFGEED